MRLFLQRVKTLIFSVGTLAGIIFGIILGIFLGLPYYIWLFMLMAWMIIPVGLMRLFSGQSVIADSAGGLPPYYPGWVSWADWGVGLFYLLFLCYYGWHAYRATRRTGLVSDGIGSTLWSALMMILCAIIPSALTMMWPQWSFSLFFFYLGGALELCLIFAIPLGFLVSLVGFVGAMIGKRSYAQKCA